MTNATRINRALFINRVMENAENYGAQAIHQQNVSSHSGGVPVNPNNVSGYNTLQAAAEAATMQRQEEDALTNSTQKGEAEEIATAEKDE